MIFLSPPKLRRCTTYIYPTRININGGSVVKLDSSKSLIIYTPKHKILRKKSRLRKTMDRRKKILLNKYYSTKVILSHEIS